MMLGNKLKLRIRRRNLRMMMRNANSKPNVIDKDTEN